MNYERITAIILAAGKSRRMGQPKMLMPWGRKTVLGQVITILAAAGISDIVIVTGGVHEQVERVVSGLASTFPVRATFNPDYDQGEMLSSIKAGLRAIGTSADAALIALGDQPQIREETVRKVCTAFLESGSPLIIPSCENQRGHPWLAGRPFWDGILALPPSATSRQFLNAHAAEVKYVIADQSVLRDLDTLEDYYRLRP